MAKKRESSVRTLSDSDWEAQRDLETLIEAERIEKDPKRLAKARALAKQRLLDIASVASEGKDES